MAMIPMGVNVIPAVPVGAISPHTLPLPSQGIAGQLM